MTTPARTAPASIARTKREVVLRRAQATEAARLPHPSWRRALGAAPGTEGERLASASEFWSRLGI